MGFENNVKLKRVPTSYTGNGRQNNIMVDDLGSTNILRSSFLIVSALLSDGYCGYLRRSVQSSEL